MHISWPQRLRNSPIRDRKVFCWAMYDWANSGYTTLSITVLVAYIQRVVYPADVWGNTGPVVWAWGIALSMLLGAVLSPVVGAIADSGDSKRVWLAATAFTGAAACLAMAALPPSWYVLVTALFVVANLMLELSLGIYNGFLPQIVPEKQVNAASSWGYGLGYLGGGLLLLIAMLLLSYGEHVGLSNMQQRLRVCLMMTGIWWAVFTLPAILGLHDVEGKNPGKMSRKRAVTESLREGLSQVKQTVAGLKHRLPLLYFLLAFLFYNDAVQTVISQSSTFALVELRMPEWELMAVILMIQFVAVPGAMVVGLAADVFGKKRTVMGCLFVWCCVLMSALFVRSSTGFWVMAVFIALVLGAIQSVSRSIMVDLIPDRRNAEYFGFFNLSGKATSFVGTFLFGAIIAITGSSRFAIVGLLPLFLMGAWFLRKVHLEHDGSV